MTETAPRITLNDLRLRKDGRGALIGQTGCGKSFLARQLLPADGSLAIVDPKRTFKYDKDVRVYSNPELLLFARPRRFIYRPHPKYLNDIGAYNAIYEYCYKLKNILVYTDDLVGILSKTQYPRYLQVCYQMGRELNVSMLTAFQRPTLLPLFILSESDKFYAFKLHLKRDVERIREFAIGYEPDKLVFDREKKIHEFAFFDQHKTTRCVTCWINAKTTEGK